MKRLIGILKSCLGYTWVIAVIFLAIAGLMNMETFANKLFVNNGFQVTANWQGGKIDTEKTYQGYRTVIHQPVFEGLFDNTRHGFIQIDWVGEPTLPERIIEKVDYDQDGRVDFTIRLNTSDNQVDFQSFHGSKFILGGDRVLVYDKSRSIRILIDK